MYKLAGTKVQRVHAGMSRQQRGLILCVSGLWIIVQM